MQYIIFDLEATCWERAPKGTLHEIIEIGAARMDENARIQDTFQTFVKPTKNPTLSAFCTELTSITQAEVDSAPFFAEALILFEAWIGAGETQLLSWGRYDKSQLLTECAAKHYDGTVLQLLETHRSFKHDFAAMRGIRPCGMAGALRLLDIPLAGTHHRGIDDAVNISKIFHAVFPAWRAYAQPAGTGNG